MIGFTFSSVIIITTSTMRWNGEGGGGLYLLLSAYITS